MKNYKDIVAMQKELCEKYHVEWVESSPMMKIGIAKNTLTAGMPINGLRHPIEKDMSGWYLWASEGFPKDQDAFDSMHIEHLDSYLSQVLKYLGFPPGWRFLIDSKGYEDVWFDEKLLQI